METSQEIADSINLNFTVSEYALGRQRCRKWASLITQQLRLRHVYQIYAYNIDEDKKSTFYFTLHSTPMSSPFYTSEKVYGKNPKWNELLFSNSIDTNVSCVVIRIWKNSKKGDEILITWGVNFSGLVYLGNKIADLQPKFFKANTVIFFMQGVYFTSQHYLCNDLDKSLPFQKYLNLIETSHEEQVLYRRVAFKAPKGEVTSSYTLDKLRRLQELQRQMKNNRINVENIKEKIKKATETEQKQGDSYASAYNNNIRFAPQLLTMNSLNKMLHEKPTKAEREAMSAINKKMEGYKFRMRILYQERDKKSVNLRRLKQREAKLREENEEKNANLMSLYHTLSKESQHWDEFRHDLPRQKQLLVMVQEQLHCRQLELLKELLFIYPIDKIANENKYTILGIHLPDSELLLDYQDPGVSVVLGYICHILIMCSIFLQVPLRHPMKHFGSRSVIYNQVYPEIPDKEREFPLYTKGKDRAHFSYAVFLLNKNISQLRWYLHHKFTVDLKETLKHLRSLLLGDDLGEHRRTFEYHREKKTKSTSLKASTIIKKSSVTLDNNMLVSPISSISSSNLNDPLLERIHKELRRERYGPDGASITTSPKKKLTLFKSVQTKRDRKEKYQKTSSEVLAVPEAYLNRQISKDLFQKCASGGYKFGEKAGTSEDNAIKIREGVEEFQASVDVNSANSDSVEEGTDPLDPSTNLDLLITKSIDIQNPDRPNNENNRISRSMDSYVEDNVSNLYKTCELGSNPIINASCNSDRKISGASGMERLEKWLTTDTSEPIFPDECLRMSLQSISSPLTERTDRLLSTNQSFNLVKHRPME